MNNLITALMVGVFTGGCVSVPVQGLGTAIMEENVHKKWFVTSAVDSETAFSQQEWTGLGYTGPTALPVLLGDGTIAETPEVAAARAAHLAALEISQGTNPDMDDGHYDPRKYGDHLYGINEHSQDLSKSIVTYKSLAQDRHVSGTAATNAQHAASKGQEAAHSQKKASAEDEAARALWKAKNAPAGGLTYGVPVEQNNAYLGPLAMLQVLPTGYLADTEEVAAAKKIHLSALAEAEAAEALWKAKYVQSQHHPWN